MSGIGHLAPGFAAKAAAPNIPLWVWLAAGEANDLLYFLFSTAGVEPKAVTTMNFTEGVRYLTPVANPWSHGLFMSVVWSVMAAGLAFLIYRERRSSLILGSLVFSHWIFDFLMHSNLPLLFESSPRIGLGLEKTGTGFLVVTVFDIVILAFALFIYFRAKKKIVFALKETP